jgi:hypothetical protein
MRAALHFVNAAVGKSNPLQKHRCGTYMQNKDGLGAVIDRCYLATSGLNRQISFIRKR